MSDSLGRLTRLGFTSVPECLLCAPKEYRDFLEPLHILPVPDQQQKHYLVLTLTEQEMFDRNGQGTNHWDKTHRLNMRAVDGRGDLSSSRRDSVGDRACGGAGGVAQPGRDP